MFQQTTACRNLNFKDCAIPLLCLKPTRHCPQKAKISFIACLSNTKNPKFSVIYWRCINWTEQMIICLGQTLLTLLTFNLFLITFSTTFLRPSHTPTNPHTQCQPAPFLLVFHPGPLSHSSSAKVSGLHCRSAIWAKADKSSCWTGSACRSARSQRSLTFRGDGRDLWQSRKECQRC